MKKIIHILTIGLLILAVIFWYEWINTADTTVFILATVGSTVDTVMFISLWKAKDLDL